MKAIGIGHQAIAAPLYDASGTITTGGTPQLVLGRSISRSSLIFQNLSSANLLIEIGSARAAATLTSGAVSSVAVTNAGMGFSRPPIIEFLGGGGGVPYTGLGQPNATAPSRPAQAHCVMTGTAPNQTVASIVVDDPGSGYLIAPYVFIQNDPLDPNGGAAPTAAVGILLGIGSGPLAWAGSSCPTETVTVFGGTTAQAFTCKWMD